MDWFHDSVKYIDESGIMVGTSHIAFSPYWDISHGMIATILWRMEGEPRDGTPNPYTDVTTGAYYYDAVACGDTSKALSWATATKNKAPTPPSPVNSLPPSCGGTPSTTAGTCPWARAAISSILLKPHTYPQKVVAPMKGRQPFLVPQKPSARQPKLTFQTSPNILFYALKEIETFC